MTRPPPRRLLEAAGALEAADRALLNLWINRGLDDERLAELTGMSAVVVQSRRERILSSLGEQLGVAESDVLASLRSLDPGEATSDTGRPDVTATDGSLGSPATVSSTGLPRPATASREAQSEVEPEGIGGDPEPEAQPPPDGGVSGGRRGRWWAALSAAIAVAVAVVLVVLLTGGSPSAPPKADPAVTVAATTTSTPAPASTTTASTSTTATTSPDHLSGLPGGPAHVSGMVRLVGKVGHLKLNLTVKGLPLVHHAYYAAWLFNSVLDSRRLGRITRDAVNTYRLPAGARRFRFIDVSLQPKGTFSHSGESKLRAANPVDGPKAIIHQARARRPRHLHKAVVHPGAQKTGHRPATHARRARRHSHPGRRSRARRHSGAHRHHATRHHPARRHRARRHRAHRHRADQRRRGRRSSTASTS
jgi:hypothetical protein